MSDQEIPKGATRDQLMDVLRLARAELATADPESPMVLAIDEVLDPETLPVERPAVRDVPTDVDELVVWAWERLRPLTLELDELGIASVTVLAAYDRLDQDHCLMTGSRAPRWVARGMLEETLDRFRTYTNKEAEWQQANGYTEQSTLAELRGEDDEEPES